MTVDELIDLFGPADVSEFRKSIELTVAMYREVSSADGGSPRLSEIRSDLAAERKRLTKAQTKLSEVGRNVRFTHQIHDPVADAAYAVGHALEILADLESRWPKENVARNTFRLNFNEPDSQLARTCYQVVVDHYRGDDRKRAYDELAFHVQDTVGKTDIDQSTETSDRNWSYFEQVTPLNRELAQLLLPEIRAKFSEEQIAERRQEISDQINEIANRYQRRHNA